MAKFIKKPIVIEAVQWKGSANGDGTSIIEVYNFLTGEKITGSIYAKSEGEHFRIDRIYNIPTLIIKTLEGEMQTSINDWIIKGVNGEYYPCKPDIFEKTYEAVN